MTDDEVIKHAQELCDRGDRVPLSHTVDVPRLRKRISLDDTVEACYMVPALLEIIERRGLKDTK